MAVANEMSKQCISANCSSLIDSVWILLAKISVETFQLNKSAFFNKSLKVYNVYTLLINNIQNQDPIFNGHPKILDVLCNIPAYTFGNVGIITKI